MGTHVSRETTLESLNELLRMELAVGEAYRHALRNVEGLPQKQLEIGLDAHEERAAALRGRIQMLTGTPAGSSGAWGAYLRLIQGSADLLGKQAALLALEEDEDQALSDYRRLLGQVDEETRVFVEMRLLPGQRRSLERIGDLKRDL
jgi:bacterioferritin (cytochrome b1)